MSRIKLKVQGVTDISSVSNAASLLIITDEEEKRHISIVVDEAMRYQFGLRRGKYVGEPEQRKKVAEHLQNCLPETLISILKYLTKVDLAVVIVSVFDGQYQTLLEDRKTGTSFHIRASDGVLLSYSDQHIPLFIEESLWQKQSYEYQKDATGVAIPVNTLSVPMLKMALDKCIEEERYEMAEQLKKELERRSNH